MVAHMTVIDPGIPGSMGLISHWSRTPAPPHLKCSQEWGLGPLRQGRMGTHRLEPAQVRVTLHPRSEIYNCLRCKFVSGWNSFEENVSAFKSASDFPFSFSLNQLWTEKWALPVLSARNIWLLSSLSFGSFFSCPSHPRTLAPESLQTCEPRLGLRIRRESHHPPGTSWRLSHAPERPPGQWGSKACAKGLCQRLAWQPRDTLSTEDHLSWGLGE